MEPELVEALAAVRARGEDLIRREGWAEEVAARRAEVVRWRRATSRSKDIASPIPLVVRGTSNADGRWLADDEPLGHHEDRVGFDATERPVVHERADDGYVNHTWRYAGPLVEETTFQGGAARVAWLLPDGTGAVGADAGTGWVERWRRHDGRVVRVEHAGAGEGNWVTGRATEADLDATGEVVRLRRAVVEREIDETTRLSASEVLPALAAALEEAAGLVCERVVWEAPLDRPAALRADTEGMAEALTDGLVEAILAAAGAAGVDEPFCLDVGPGTRKFEPQRLPPGVRLAGRTWLERMRVSSPEDGEAYRSLWRGVESGEVAELDVVGHCSDATLRGCRELATALDGQAPPGDEARAEPVIASLARGLTERLNAPRAWPAAARDFLALVRIPATRFGDADAMRLARSVCGDARVDAFLAATASRAPSRALDPDQVRAALADRTALERLLRTAGLEQSAARLAHEVAEVGLRLEIPGAASGSPRSRLGGPGLLPRGAVWPRSSGDRPLAFLAGLDLAELPPVDRGTAWPDAGWLLFFADLGDDADELGLIEPAGNGEGSPARVLAIPAGDEPEPAAAPAGVVVLREQHIAFGSILTLPDGYDAPSQLGLDVYAAAAYETVLERLRRARDGDSAAVASEAGIAIVFGADDEETREEPSPRRIGIYGDHWIRGHAVGAQGESPERGTVLLLSLTSDPAIDFEYLDGGVIQFRVPAKALEGRDWSAVVALPDSG